MQLACSKGDSETTGGRTVKQYVEHHRELRSREEQVNAEVKEAADKEYLAGLLILVCPTDDPHLRPIIAQLQQDAIQQKQKALREVRSPRQPGDICEIQKCTQLSTLKVDFRTLSVHRGASTK